VDNKNKTRFVNRLIGHELRRQEFEQMIRKIANKASMSPELIRKYSTKALKTWENVDPLHRDVLTLFTATPDSRSLEISKILDHFRDSLRPIVFSEKKLDLAMKIAAESFETMYNIF
jgi:hypothetical protein